MKGRDLFRYGWRYAALYVGGLAAIVAANWIALMFFKFTPRDMSIGAFILAAMLAFNRFLKDRERVPTRSEYWSLVFLCTVIVVIVDVSLTVLAIGWEWHRDAGLLPLLLGLPLFKGLLGNCLFFSDFAAWRWLKSIEHKKAKNEARRSA